MMAMAAGHPPRQEGREFSHVKVEILPDTLLALDPREAITRLMAEPVVRDGSPPAGGLDFTRRTRVTLPLVTARTRARCPSSTRTPRPAYPLGAS